MAIIARSPPPGARPGLIPAAGARGSPRGALPERCARLPREGRSDLRGASREAPRLDPRLFGAQPGARGSRRCRGPQQLARYMLRAPVSLEKNDLRCAHRHRHLPKMHAALKRNFQLMPGAQWLELLCRHIPDRYERLVQHAGWYSNRVRGERAKRAAPEHAPQALATPAEAKSDIAVRAKATWARLCGLWRSSMTRYPANAAPSSATPWAPCRRASPRSARLSPPTA